MTLWLFLVLSQVAPAPWDEPLAPAYAAPQSAPAPSWEPLARDTYLQTLANGVIHFFEATGSHSTSKDCNFRPSCTVYGHQAIEKLGGVPGLIVFGARLMRAQVNFDRFYLFDGVLLLEPLEDTLAWLQPHEDIPTWQRLRLRSWQRSSPVNTR